MGCCTSPVQMDPTIINCGLCCCTFSILMPQALFRLQGKLLCLKCAGAFPFQRPLPGPVCAVCCLQCIPNVGCMKPPMKAKTVAGEGGGPPAPTEMQR